MATLRVSNQTELNNALKAVQGGDTILLSSGTYNELRLSTGWEKNYNFNQKITISSANYSNPAVIKEMFIRKASNVEIKDLTLDYVGSQQSSTPSWLKGKPFFIQDSKNITINNVDFDGHLKNGYGQERGLRVTNTDGLTVKDSEFSNFKIALDVSLSEDVTLSGNLITGMSHDGFNFGDVTRLLIENNRFTNFKAPDPDALHKDAIQFRTNSTEGASTAVVIRDNTFDLAEVVQSIYIGNELYKAGRTAEFHRNFLIEDNYIYTAQALGIAMIHGDGVVIRDNTLVHNSNKGYDDWENIPLISVSRSSYNVDILNNRAANVPDPQNSTWTVSGNITTNTKYKPEYWESFQLGRMITVVTDTVQDVLKGVGGTVSLSPKPEPEVETETPPRIGDGVDEITVGSDSGRYVDEETFRINGLDMEGDTRFVIERFSLSREDKLILANFDRGAFEGKYGKNAIWSWNDASSTKIDSALDFQELNAISSQFSASTQNDDLILRVDRDDYTAEIVIENMAAAYRAANQPELF